MDSDIRVKVNNILENWDDRKPLPEWVRLYLAYGDDWEKKHKEYLLEQEEKMNNREKEFVERTNKIFKEHDEYLRKYYSNPNNPLMKSWHTEIIQDMNYQQHIEDSYETYVNPYSDDEDDEVILSKIKRRPRDSENSDDSKSENSDDDYIDEYAMRRGATAYI
jgi:hypothetical protein